MLILFALIVAAKMAVHATLQPGKLCDLLVLAFLGAGLAHFLDFAQDKGEIFRFWRAALFRALWFKGRPRRWRTLAGAGVMTKSRWGKLPSYQRHRPASAWRRGLYKILGGCIYCASVWSGSFFYFVGASLSGAPFALTAWGWPLFVGAQFAFIEFIFLAIPPKK